MRITKIINLIGGAALAMYAAPVVPAAAAGMGGGGGVGFASVGVSMPGSPGMANGGIAGYTHGSPAASNPAVALGEARQRDAQVGAEIEQSRRVGKSVSMAVANREKGEKALQAGLADKAMLHFDAAEEAIGIRQSTASMGSYSASLTGSVAPGGTEYSGAIVH
jgi:hypothetical protein